MAALKRGFPAGLPQHAVQRGNNRQVCFAIGEDGTAYARWFYEASNRYQISIHGCVFMTSRVHLNKGLSLGVEELKNQVEATNPT